MVQSKKGKSRKKRFLAVIGDACSGCAGSPVCIAMCPVEGALEYVPDEDAYPFGRVIVHSKKCIGCGLCATKGYEGAITEGCPWEAVAMIRLEDGAAAL